MVLLTLTGEHLLFAIGKAFALWKQAQQKKIERKAIKCAAHLSGLTMMLTPVPAMPVTSNSFHLLQGRQQQLSVGQLWHRALGTSSPQDALSDPRPLQKTKQRSLLAPHRAHQERRSSGLQLTLPAEVSPVCWRVNLALSLPNASRAPPSDRNSIPDGRFLVILVRQRRSQRPHHQHMVAGSLRGARTSTLCRQRVRHQVSRVTSRPTAAGAACGRS